MSFFSYYAARLARGFRQRHTAPPYFAILFHRSIAFTFGFNCCSVFDICSERAMPSVEPVYSVSDAIFAWFSEITAAAASAVLRCATAA